jgi:hypothetical protein
MVNLRNLPKIISYEYSKPGVDDLAHATFVDNHGKRWFGDMTDERLKEKLALRKLVKTLGSRQIDLFEKYLDLKEEADESEDFWEED